MAAQAFEDIVEDFEFMEDWEDRYRYVIEMGKNMPPLEDAFKVEANKVHGCASQVWMQQSVEGGVYRFDGDSDALIVRGLVAVLRALVNGEAVSEVAKVDIESELARLDLASNLSSQRSNGLRSMVAKIRDFATQ
jgi:cysteine desulfuration protein SufE